MNGCNFCKGQYMSLVDNKINSKNRYCLQLNGNKIEILKQIGNDVYWNMFLNSVKKIKYCSLCGNKLKGDFDE